MLPRYIDTQVYQSLSRGPGQRARRPHDCDVRGNEERGWSGANLTLAYNEARQAAITEEITEIVGGAEAQK